MRYFWFSDLIQMTGGRTDCDIIRALSMMHALFKKKIFCLHISLLTSLLKGKNVMADDSRRPRYGVED